MKEEDIERSPIVKKILNIYLNKRRFEIGHSVSPISNLEVDPSKDVTGHIPLQIFKEIKKPIQKETNKETIINIENDAALIPKKYLK
jgi:hypothetical protein